MGLMGLIGLMGLMGLIGLMGPIRLIWLIISYPKLTGRPYSSVRGSSWLAL